MSIFSRGDEFIDYTLLKRKGLLKVEEPKGDIDYTQCISNPPATSSSSGSSSPSFGDFFGTSSSSGPGEMNTDIPNPFSGLDSQTPGGLPGPSMPSPGGSGDELKEMNALKIKLDDLEYKLEKLLERLGKIEEQK